jgi:hypothetical protein
MPQPKFDVPRFDFDVISQPAMPPPPPPQPVLWPADAAPGMAKSDNPGHNPPRLNPGRGDQR